MLSGVIRNTSLVYSPAFSKAIGNQIYIKPENIQVTGAYKIRGAYYKISTLSGEGKVRGLATASAGNHAQGVVYAAQAAGVSATIATLTTTPLVKVNNMKDYGAKVVLHGETSDDAAELAAKLPEEEGLIYAHPFNDLAIATGQGTISYETSQDLLDVDVISAPIGGGGLATGVSTLARLLNPDVTVIGVEPSGAAPMKASLDADHVITLDQMETIVDGVAVKTPGDQIFPYLQKSIDDIITTPDDELADAFLDMMEKHKMIVENAGPLPIVALSHLKYRGKNAVLVLSGGNMDVITVVSLVQYGLISRGRVFTFSIRLPDRLGELPWVIQVVAETSGNVIKLEHNQFVSISHQSGVELRVTLEVFGHTHKRVILDALCGVDYAARECHTSDFYHRASQARSMLEPPAYLGESFPRIRLCDVACFFRSMGRRAGAVWARGRAGGASGVIHLVYLICPLLRLSRPRLSPGAHPIMEL